MDEPRLPEPAPDPVTRVRAWWWRVAHGAGVGMVWTVGIAVVVAAVGILGLVWFSRRPEGGRFSLQLANRTLARVSNLRLSAERSLLLDHGARLVRPVVSVVDSSGRASRFLEADDVVVRTSWWSLLRGAPDEIDIEVTRPRIALRRDAAGRLRLPVFRASGKKPRPDARGVYHLHLSGGSVVLEDTDGALDTLARDVDLTARAGQRGPHWGIVVERGAGYLPAMRLRLARVDGSGSYEDSRLAISTLRVRTDGGWVEARGEGRVVPRLDVRGTIELGEWTWARIAGWTGQKALDLPGGFAGSFVYHASGDSLAVDHGAFDVLWRDEPMRLTAGGLWSKGHLVLDDMALDWRDTSWRGGFAWLAGKEGGWALDGRITGLDLSSLPRIWPMPALDPSRIDGRVRLTGDARGLDGEVVEAHGTWREVPFSGLAGTWALRDRRQALDARAGVAGGVLTARGTIAPGALDLAATATDVAAGAMPAAWWTALGLAHAPAGRIAALDARLVGPAGAPQVTGTAEVRDAAYDAFGVAAVALRFDGTLGAAAGGTVHAEATDAHVGPSRADTAFVDATVSRDRIDIGAFRAARGDSVLTFAGRAERAGTAWEVALDRVAWDVGETLAFETEGPARARLERGGVVRVERLHVLSTAGSFAAQGTWGGGRQPSDLTLDLETLDLEDVLGPFMPGAGARGTVTGRARVQGRGEDLVYTVDLEGRELRWMRASARQLTARGRFARAAWEVEELALDTGRGRLRFTGDVAWARPPDVGGGREGWDRALTASPRWHGELVADSLGVDALAEWIPSLGGWRGALDATFTLDGRPADPVVTARGFLRRPGWGQATLDDFALDLVYRDELVEVRRFAVAGPDSVGPSVTGRLPLRLGWGVKAADRLPDRPMDLTAIARGLDLGLVPLVLPQIAAAGGRFDVTAHVGGTPRTPLLTGALTVRDGIVRPASREEVLTQVDGRVVLRGDRLEIERLTARQGKKGRVVVRPGGWGTLKDLRIETYAFDVDVASVTAFASGEYVIVLDGAFKVTNGLDLGGPLPLPHITGTARVQEGLFLYNFADPTRQLATQGPLVAPPWTYQIDVEAESNVWYRPSDANIEGRLSDFQVIQGADRFLMLGGVEALRGRYYFLGNSFDLKSGNLFFDTAQPLDPTVDAVLTTEKILTVNGSPNARETITLTVTGRALEPKVTLSSDPTALSQSEIVELLTYGQVGSGGRALVAAGSRYLARQLLREVPELSQVLGDIEVGERVSEEDLAQQKAAESFTTVGVTRYFTRDLLVRYSQVVGDVSQTAAVDYQDLTAEYRLNRLLFLSGQVTRRRGVLITSQDQTIYNLDVRARHEY